MMMRMVIKIMFKCFFDLECLEEDCTAMNAMRLRNACKLLS
jgi:hypothetical protein